MLILLYWGFEYMKVVLIKSPGFLGFFLRKMFGIKKEKI